jgi:hypothetical protein
MPARRMSSIFALAGALETKYFTSSVLALLARISQ